MRTVLLMLLGTLTWLAIPDSGFAQYRGGPYYRGPVYGRPYAYGPYYRGYYPYNRGFYSPYGYGFGLSIYAAPWNYAYPSTRIVVVGSSPDATLPPPAPNGPNSAEPPPNGETGLKIITVADNGSADKAKLRVGDTILSVGTTRVRTLNDLRNALSTVNNGEAEIVFINPENNKREKLPVKVVEGRIGINVEQVDLK